MKYLLVGLMFFLGFELGWLFSLLRFRKGAHKRTVVAHFPLIELGKSYFDDGCGYQLFFVNPKYIEIRYDDSYFYQDVEKKKDELRGCITKYAEIQNLMDTGVTREKLAFVPGLSRAVESCFGIHRIQGCIVNGKIRIINGRHRYVVAKEMDAKLPVFIWNTITQRQ